MFNHFSDVYRYLAGCSRQSYMYLLLTLVGLVWIGVGILLFVFDTQQQIEISPDLLEDTTSIPPGLITVDVAGGVTTPGIYQLPSDARLHQAVMAAGGLSPEADLQKVQDQINLAAKINDGDKIVVPTGEENNQPAAALPKPSIAGEQERISFNQATQTSLETLPGIGEKKASDILANRPYSSMGEVKDILKVSDAQWTVIEKLTQL
jgi:competence protein ComEA